MAIYKSRSDKVLFGVAGGVAKKLEVGSGLVRVMITVGFFMSAGLVLPIYILLGIALEFDPNEPEAQEANRGERSY
jgi:phage shock protein PspC (stress-responsive transcriptional regulator)